MNRKNINMDNDLYSKLDRLMKLSNLSELVSVTSQLAVLQKTIAAQKPLEVETWMAANLSMMQKVNKYKNFLESFYQQSVNPLDRVNNEILQHSTANVVQKEIDRFSMLSEMLQGTSTFTVSGLYKRYYQEMAPIRESMCEIDLEVLGNATDKVLETKEKLDSDTAAEAIALEYARAQEEATEERTQIRGKHDDRAQEKKGIGVNEVREWINTIIALLTLLFSITPSQIPSVNIINYTQQVNNYYVINMGYDASELNMENFRIINQAVTVRRKHDCHSMIIDNLKEGQIVQVIGKYKKWRLVVWENDEKRKGKGWVQNYKLTKFKLPKNIRKC